MMSFAIGSFEAIAAFFFARNVSLWALIAVEGGRKCCVTDAGMGRGVILRGVKPDLAINAPVIPGGL